MRNRLVTEWVKKDACWKRIEASSIALSQSFIDTLVGALAAPRRPRDWRSRAYNLWRQGTWKRLHEWNKTANVLTPGEAEFVEHAAMAREFRLRGFRLTKLGEAWERAVGQGFV